VLTPTSGSVSVQGKVSTLLELGAGFNPELSGMENIFFYGSINGIKRKDMEKFVEPILEFADIGEYIFQPVKSFSSGMFVRLAFAVAVQIEPDILIVDEALAVGDIFFQQKCSRRMLEMREKGITILFVSHDMSSVRNICSRVIFLYKGEIKEDGEPNGIITDYYKIGDHADEEDHKLGSLQKTDNRENENLSLADFSINDIHGIKTESFKINETAVFRASVKSKKELNDIHPVIALKNRFGTVIFIGSSYNDKGTGFSFSENSVYSVEFQLKLSVEAGLYSVDLSFGIPIEGKVNQAMNCFEIQNISGLTVIWDYENEIAPFYGLCSLELKTSLIKS
ncbi:MAG TPA: ABC transporter ATP-binding protein, partial [Leptospiraceae bacterium]|nr:ABC transporter ATP-binding protein [Leptospiraceae bacterium]